MQEVRNPSQQLNYEAKLLSKFLQALNKCTLLLTQPLKTTNTRSMIDLPIPRENPSPCGRGSQRWWRCRSSSKSGQTKVRGKENLRPPKKENSLFKLNPKAAWLNPFQPGTTPFWTLTKPSTPSLPTKFSTWSSLSSRDPTQHGWSWRRSSCWASSSNPTLPAEKLRQRLRRVDLLQTVSFPSTEKGAKQLISFL